MVKMSSTLRELHNNKGAYFVYWYVQHLETYEIVAGMVDYTTFYIVSQHEIF